MASVFETLVMEVIAIAEGPEDEALRNREAMTLAHRIAAKHPNMVGYLADDLLSAAASGRHAPRSEKLLSEVGSMLSQMGAAERSAQG